MSGSIGLSTAPFTDAEKTDLRRFCGYPAYGSGFASSAGYRFFQAYGFLEYKLNNLLPAEYQVARQYLAQLYPLESAVIGASANLDTDQAAVWYHNKNEVADRTGLFRKWRMELCAMLGTPPGPSLNSGDGRVSV